MFALIGSGTVGVALPRLRLSLIVLPLPPSPHFVAAHRHPVYAVHQAGKDDRRRLAGRDVTVFSDEQDPEASRMDMIAGAQSCCPHPALEDIEAQQFAVGELHFASGQQHVLMRPARVRGGGREDEQQPVLVPVAGEVTLRHGGRGRGGE